MFSKKIKSFSHREFPEILLSTRDIQENIESVNLYYKFFFRKNLELELDIFKIYLFLLNLISIFEKKLMIFCKSKLIRLPELKEAGHLDSSP